MTQPLTTPRRKLTREEEMAWPNLPPEMPSRDEVDPEPHASLMPPFIGPRRKKPNRKLTPQEQRQLDEESMRLRCLGKTYRQNRPALGYRHVHGVRQGETPSLPAAKALS